jgi:hypothetical protein
MQLQKRFAICTLPKLPHYAMLDRSAMTHIDLVQLQCLVKQCVSCIALYVTPADAVCITHRLQRRNVRHCTAQYRADTAWLTWESNRVTVQVLLRTAAALVTNTSNTRRAVPSDAMLTDCAAMGATEPVQFATWDKFDRPAIKQSVAVTEYYSGKLEERSAMHSLPTSMPTGQAGTPDRPSNHVPWQSRPRAGPLKRRIPTETVKLESM